jgi:hypothetical protein
MMSVCGERVDRNRVVVVHLSVIGLRKSVRARSGAGVYLTYDNLERSCDEVLRHGSLLGREPEGCESE